MAEDNNKELTFAEIIDKINDVCKGYDKQLKAINLQCCGS